MRPASVGGSSFCTSASTPAGNSSGMPCACTAIRLILRWSSRIAQRLDDARLRHAERLRRAPGRSGPDRRPWRRPRRRARSAIPSAPCGRRGRSGRRPWALARKMPSWRRFSLRQPLDRLRLVAVAGDVRLSSRVSRARMRSPCPSAGSPRAPGRAAPARARAGARPRPRPTRQARRSARHRRRGRRSPARRPAAACPRSLKPLRLPRSRPSSRHLGEQALEGDAVAALDGEGARDLALAGLGAGSAHEVEDFLLARQSRVAAGFFGFAGHRRGGS